MKVRQLSVVVEVNGSAFSADYTDLPRNLTDRQLRELVQALAATAATKAIPDADIPR